MANDNTQTDNRTRLVGRVVSDKMDKTIVVAIENLKAHPIYGKVMRTTKKVMAHEPTNAIGIGTTVRLVESRPYSKRKRWTVEEIIQDAGDIILEPVDAQETTPQQQLEEALPEEEQAAAATETEEDDAAPAEDEEASDEEAGR